MVSGVGSSGWVTLDNGDTVELASPLRRLVAWCVDAFLLLAILTVFVYWWSMARHGRTLGKLICGVKVVNAADGSSPGCGKAFSRGVIPFLLSFTIVGWILCFASVLWHQSYQGWHDRSSGTVVLHV